MYTESDDAVGKLQCGSSHLTVPTTTYMIAKTQPQVCSLLHVPSSSLHLGAFLNEAARESPDTY